MIKTLEELNHEFEIEFLFGIPDDCPVDLTDTGNIDELIPDLLDSIPADQLDELAKDLSICPCEALEKAPETLPAAPLTPAIAGLAREDLPAPPDDIDFDFVLPFEDVFFPENSSSKSELQEEPPDEPGGPEGKKRRLSKYLSNFLFYFAIITILLAAFSFSFSNGRSKIFLGYSFMTVVSDSMQPEIPRGALVIAKEVDEKEIKRGDDITFFDIEGNRVNTHRVVDIRENYGDKGERAFVTQGVANPEPDPDVVFSVNIIGLVVSSIPELGLLMKYISDNKIMVFILFGVIILASIAIQWFFNESAKEKNASASMKRRTAPQVVDVSYVSY